MEAEARRWHARDGRYAHARAPRRASLNPEGDFVPLLAKGLRPLALPGSDQIDERGGDSVGQLTLAALCRPAEVVAAVHFERRGPRRDERAGSGELFGAGEWIRSAVDEQRRYPDRLQVRGAQVLWLAGRMQRIGL